MVQSFKSVVDPVKSTLKIHTGLIVVLFFLVIVSIILPFVMPKMKHHEHYYATGGSSSQYTPGTTILCQQDDGTSKQGTVYQINKGRRFALSPAIASSCNPNWQSNSEMVNCSNISEGPAQTVNCSPVAPPGGFTLVNPRTG